MQICRRVESSWQKRDNAKSPHATQVGDLCHVVKLRAMKSEDRNGRGEGGDIFLPSIIEDLGDGGEPLSNRSAIRNIAGVQSSGVVLEATPGINR